MRTTPPLTRHRQACRDARDFRLLGLSRRGAGKRNDEEQGRKDNWKEWHHGFSFTAWSRVRAEKPRGRRGVGILHQAEQLCLPVDTRVVTPRCSCARGYNERTRP